MTEATPPSFPTGAGGSTPRSRRGDSAEGAGVGLGAAAFFVFAAVNEGALDAVFRQQLGLAILWAFGLMLIFGVLPRSGRSSTRRRLLLSFCVLFGWSALSLLWTESAERTYGDLARLATYGGLMALVLLGVTRDTWKHAAAGWCAALMGVPVLSFLSRAIPGAFDSGALAGFERLSFPLGYWNALACWCAIALTAAVALSGSLRSPPLRAAALGSAPVAALVLYLTFSRGGIFAAAVGLGAVFVLTRNRISCFVHLLAVAAVSSGLIAFAAETPGLQRGEGSPALVALTLIGCLACALVASWTRSLHLDRKVSRTRAGMALGTLATAGIIAAGLVVGGEGISGAREEFTSGRYPSEQGSPAARLTTLEGARVEIWSSALAAAASSPVEGIGAGAFDLWWSRDVADGEDLKEPHSLYLGQLAELGSVGFLLLLATLGLMLAAAARAIPTRSRSGHALGVALTAGFGVFLVHAGIDWIWESTAVAFLALGGAMIVTAGSQSPRTRRDRRKGARKWRVAFSIMAIAAGAAIIPGTVAIQRQEASFSLSAIGQTERALEAADDAVTAAPWLASPYATRALTRAGTGDLDLARQDALSAIDREPTNWRHWLLLAGIEGQARDPVAAAAALREAANLNPGLALSAEDLLPGAEAGP